MHVSMHKIFVSAPRVRLRRSSLRSRPCCASVSARALVPRAARRRSPTPRERGGPPGAAADRATAPPASTLPPHRCLAGQYCARSMSICYSQWYHCEPAVNKRLQRPEETAPPSPALALTVPARARRGKSRSRRRDVRPPLDRALPASLDPGRPEEPRPRRRGEPIWMRRVRPS
jgi:hypothetical protein